MGGEDDGGDGEKGEGLKIHTGLKYSIPNGIFIFVSNVEALTFLTSSTSKSIAVNAEIWRTISCHDMLPSGQEDTVTSPSP